MAHPSTSPAHQFLASRGRKAGTRVSTRGLGRCPGCVPDGLLGNLDGRRRRDLSRRLDGCRPSRGAFRSSNPTRRTVTNPHRRGALLLAGRAFQEYWAASVERLRETSREAAGPRSSGLVDNTPGPGERPARSPCAGAGTGSLRAGQARHRCRAGHPDPGRARAAAGTPPPMTRQPVPAHLE